MNQIRWISLLAIGLYSISTFSQEIKGRVIDKKNGEAIPYCNVFIPSLNTGTRTDSAGIFNLNNIPGKNILLQISFTGYGTQQIEVDTKDKNIEIALEEQHIELSEYIVSVPTSKLADDNIVQITKMHMLDLQRSPGNSTMDIIDNIAGVDQISTGTGIGKPVIRGLSGNRVVTYSQGIRIENQQWGDEHGLGIGSIGIRDVELIKGPNSLLYGADAIGGVIFFNDEYYAEQNSIQAFIESNVLSNSLGSQNGLGLKIHKGKYKQNFFGSYKTNADYKTPSNDRVVNTRFDDLNFKTSIGYNNAFWISNLRYSYLQNNFGITEEDSLFHQSTDRNVALPYQFVSDHKISSENTFFLGQSKLELIIGYTSNDRKEFEDNLDDPSLNMLLNTGTYNIRYHLPVVKNVHHLILGGQGMYQDNINSGEEILIPDASTKDNGLYAIWNSKVYIFDFQAGIRGDNRELNGRETISHHNEIIQPLNRSYSNLTYSLGFMVDFSEHTFRLNASSGFRAPNTSELLSDGEHEGSNRYEVGNVDLKSENANQIDFSYTYKTDHIDFTLNPFANSIMNYIYLTPSDSNINQKQVYNYTQEDALLYGGEANLHFHPHFVHWLHFESAYSNITAVNSDGDYLSLMPANNINSTIKIELDGIRKLGLTEFFLQHRYKFDQNKVALNESTTPSYQVFNCGLKFRYKLGKQILNLNAGVNNLLNAKYIDHLSRLKTYGVPAQGRNIYVGLRLDFDFKLKGYSNSTIEEIIKTN